MLMRAKVIYDPSALFAEDHIGIETARFASGKVANPGYSLSSVFIYVGIVPDREGYRLAALWEHDAPHAPKIEERQGIWLSVPELVHGSRADARKIVAAAESEPFLNTRV